MAYWPGDGKLPASIIFGTDDGILYSLKASDGTPNTWFGNNGTVDVKTPEIMNGFKVPYGILSAPNISTWRSGWRIPPTRQRRCV